MEVIVVGGFLGSGKTTTIINMGKFLAEKGKKVAIIVNEIGEIGIDGDVIKRFGFDTKEITSGCICCSLKVGLRTTMNLLVKEYKPDIIMIEPTGIAFPQIIKNEVELMNLGEEVKIAPLVTLIDGSRFKHLMKEVKEFAMRQIIDAEILGINKVDLIEPIRIPILEASVQQLNPKAKVVLLSGKDTGERFENFMHEVLPDIKEVSEKVQATVATGEASRLSEPQETEDSIKASGVGSYSAEFAIKGGENLSTEAARELTTELMNAIKIKVLKLNPEFVGHIKLFLDNGLETVKQSITIYYEEPQEDIIRSKEGAVPTFKILSAVSNVDKESLKDAVNSSVKDTFEKRRIKVHKAVHEHNHEHNHEHKNHGNVQRIVNIGRKE
ncbi:Putative metal chaperone, involved in Zn homeostasis, GTPase of COG0523 family [Methanosarcina horonobensis HB-1 = JCM 15518]|uniref:Putative metal chaperone, involved in Zn homeostasis, GTPase of COG0523 family n=1 Tax=Methanosarcina horonobensis HB-1 = JCM 15518 TaxID=1434110 RepID=A0A0E3SBV1_9EURY|nr:GTP-binding protein [Methanosarcina horonobensis]AKB76773.1 Putative metal chaperone, involved in Zn homeostasis, GTPase of COG0523 family [Methanosarcina horonobensis HB-1 = JCM 15518]